MSQELRQTFLEAILIPARACSKSKPWPGIDPAPEGLTNLVDAE